MNNQIEPGYTLKAGFSFGKSFSLKIISAKHLAKDTKAYVRVSLGNQFMKTDALKKTSNPMWNQLMFFSNWRPDQSCSLQIWGQQSGRNDRFLGCCEIPFQFEEKGLSVLSLNLTSDPRWPKPVSGVLNVEVCNFELRRIALQQTAREMETLATLRLQHSQLERGVEERASQVSGIVKEQHEVVQVNENLLAKKVKIQKMTTEVQTENEQLELALRQLLPHCEKNVAIKEEINRLEGTKRELETALTQIHHARADNARKSGEDLLWEKDEILKESVALQQAEIVALEESNKQLELKLLKMMRPSKHITSTPTAITNRGARSVSMDTGLSRPKLVNPERTSFQWSRLDSSEQVTGLDRDIPIIFER